MGGLQDRFLQDFGEALDDGSDEEEGRPGKAPPPTAADSAAARKGGGKPAEHVALFDGNTDDHFRLGIKLTRCALNPPRALNPVRAGNHAPQVL